MDPPNPIAPTKSILISSEPLDDPKTSTTLSKKEKKEAKKREKEQKKIAKKQQRARDYLTREKDFARISHNRGWQAWEEWCRGIKIEDLKNELKAASIDVENFMDKSVHAVETILDHLEHAEEQYLRNVHAHGELIDYIMKIFLLFSRSSEEMFDAEREKLISDFYKENFQRDKLLHERKRNYENYAHASVSMTKSRLIAVDRKLDDRKVEVESWSHVTRENHENLVRKREAVACSEIRNLIHVFNNVHWPKHRIDSYYETLEKSEEADKAIEELKVQTSKASKQISSLEDELHELSRNQLVRTAELKSEKLFMRKLLTEAEMKLKRESAMDHEKITKLSEISEKARKVLKSKIEKVKMVETAMRVCQKLEKLGDIPGSFCSEENEDESCGESFLLQTESFEDENNIKASRNLPEIDQQESFLRAFDSFFLKKLSNVEADCVMLRNLKLDLIKKNSNLKFLIYENQHELEVNQNLSMLRLNTSPSLGKIHQVCNQIPQIENSIKLSRRWKLCKDCEHALGNL